MQAVRQLVATVETSEIRKRVGVQEEEEPQCQTLEDRSSSRSIEHTPSGGTLRRRGTSSWGMDEASSGWVRSQVSPPP